MKKNIFYILWTKLHTEKEVRKHRVRDGIYHVAVHFEITWGLRVLCTYSFLYNAREMAVEGGEGKLLE